MRLAFSLSKSIFTTLTSTNGILDSTNFVIGSATNSSQHILYNSTTGALSYDADGNGKTAAIQFATIGTGLSSLTIHSTDFIVY